MLPARRPTQDPHDHRQAGRRNPCAGRSSTFQAGHSEPPANAVKYNPHGGTVRISGETVNDVWFRLMITDTGIRNRRKGSARLFRPFERLSAEGSDVEGTGLGLALTKRLITEMGGEIGVRSSLGEGSSFWVELLTTEAPSGGRPKDPRLAIDSTSSPVRRTDPAVHRGQPVKRPFDGTDRDPPAPRRSPQRDPGRSGFDDGPDCSTRPASSLTCILPDTPPG